MPARNTIPSNLITLAHATSLENRENPLALAELNRLVRDVPAAQNGQGHPICFTDNPHPQGYEAGIHLHAQVPTRQNNWHDHYNALAWLAYPRAKQACNQRHWLALQAQTLAGRPERGPTRDALTQWDECGVLVVSSEKLILHALAQHEWQTAFWEHRVAVQTHTRFFLFGHACCEALHAPHFGLCAKALYCFAPTAWLHTPLSQQCESIDGLLTDWLLTTDPLTPQCFGPLPLLGIPGLTPENLNQDYYQNARQFRPQRKPFSGNFLALSIG